MKKVAVAGGNAGPSKKFRFAACAAVAVGAVACPASWAQEAGHETVAQAQPQAEQPSVRVQLQTSSLPRLEPQDPGFQAPRVDMTLYPSAASSGLGAVVGLSGFTGRQNAAIQPFGLQPRPSVDVGLRWTHRLQSQQIDITAWRRMNAEDEAFALIQQRQPVYGARVEMNLSAGRKGGFALDRGFLGFQLQSGARISVKRKDGRPMVYYRTTF